MTIIKALVPHLNADDASYNIEEGGIGIYASGATFSIRCFLGGEDKFDDQKFECLPIRAGAVSPLRVVKLRVEGSDTKTIGYLFPISSLDSEEALESDDRWVRVYARAASLLVTRDGVLNEVAIPLAGATITNDLALSSCFRSDQCIVILGTNELAQVGYSASDTILMIQEYGYRPMNFGSYPTSIKESAGRISLGRPSSFLAGEVTQFAMMLEIASNISHSPSRFLCIYQIVEVLIHQIFTDHVNKIIISSASKPDPWKIRDSLIDAASEKDRISQILHNCSGIIEAEEKKSECRAACISFLSQVDPTADFTKLSWSDLLYKSRNYVVHRQHELLNRYNSEISEIGECLEKILYAVIRKFNL